MRTHVTLVLATAVLAGAVYSANEALARGGGGGGGSGRGAHMGMSSGLHWHGPMSHVGHGMRGHNPHFPSQGQHSHGKREFDRNKREHAGAHGQWHSVSGSGSHGQKWSNMQGVWHKASNSGSHGRGNKSAGGGGGGGDGDMQGVWHETGQSRGRGSQSRGLHREWQAGGEL